MFSLVCHHYILSKTMLSDSNFPLEILFHVFVLNFDSTSLLPHSCIGFDLWLLVVTFPGFRNLTQYWIEGSHVLSWVSVFKIFLLSRGSIENLNYNPCLLVTSGFFCFLSMDVFFGRYFQDLFIYQN